MVQQGKRAARAQRFTVPSNEQVLLKIEGERVVGTVGVLSTTGGALRLQHTVEAGTFAELKVKTVSGMFTAVVELLPRRSGTQPFRFVQVESADRSRLKDALQRLAAQDPAHGKPVQRVLGYARRILMR